MTFRVRVRRQVDGMVGETILDLQDQHLQEVMDRAAKAFHDPTRPQTRATPDFNPKDGSKP